MDFAVYAASIALAAWLWSIMNAKAPRPVKARIYNRSPDAARHP